MLQILHESILFAIILRANYKTQGINFFTAPELPLQLGYMNHPAEYTIAPHLHLSPSRTVIGTSEVLFVKSGKVRVDFYSLEKIFFQSTDLYAGDVILLITGGHGFFFYEPSELIEVKQGPFMGELDKARFEGATPR